MVKGKYALRSIFEDWLFQDIALIQFIFSNESLFSISEIVFRSILELVMIILFSAIFFLFFNSIFLFFVSILLAHTLNWMLNGHGFMIFFYIFCKPCPIEKKTEFLRQLKKSFDLNGISSLIYGSMSKNTANERSDIDIFIINNEGLAMGLKYVFLVTLSRLKAVFNRIPLDIYCIDEVDYLKRRLMKKKESCYFILSDPLKVIENMEVPARVLFL
jgi:predicted nucleotidyltransferase